MAMNGSSIHLNGSLLDIGRSLPSSQARSMDVPLISLPTWLSLIAYLASLAMTQTVYGEPFMNIRWVTLGALTASTLADWILVGVRGGHRHRGSIGQILTIYLLATFGTVIYAENWIFSGMRWASHAAMLAVFGIFLPQIMIPRQARTILSLVKYIMLALLLFSWLRPIIEMAPDTGTLYHGAMGNSNTMGHVAFIAALLFLQCAFVSKTSRARFLSGAMAVAAAATVWQSGARSSILALSIGVMLLFHYYRRDTQRHVMIAILLCGIAMVSFPNLPSEISRFFIKSNNPEINTFDPMRTRLPTWSAAYYGFRDRPLLGWGFGAASNMSKQSEVTLTAIGVVERDAVNDFMFMMEGCGIVGLAAYLLLIYVVVKQCPSRLQKSALQHFCHGRDANPDVTAMHHAHVTLFALSICLIVLNQFDNTALSAGNLISAILWLATGCASTLRQEIG